MKLPINNKPMFWHNGAFFPQGKFDLVCHPVGDPGASFLSQRGLYRHDAGGIVDEPGAQVVIINVERVMPNGKKISVSPRRFEKDVERLSEDIATTFDQESVIVEIQKNGITQRSFGMARR